MRFAILIMLLMLITFPPTSFSAEINCYSGKTRIYHGWGNDLIYTDHFIGFTELKTNHVVLINGDCIVMTRIKQGEKFNATTIWQEEYRA